MLVLDKRLQHVQMGDTTMSKSNILNFNNKYLDKVFREILYKKSVIDDIQSYHVDFLVDCAIVKSREADKYDLDIPRGD